MKKRVDLTGKKFGKLTVVGFKERVAYQNYWRCLCSCGNTSIVREDHLLSGHTKSCGCLRSTNARKQQLNSSIIKE